MFDTSLSLLAQIAALGFALAGAGFAQSTAETDAPADPVAAETAAATAPAALPTLPGGAQSINDVYGSWTLACMADAAGPRCAVTQVQVNQQSQQRVLSAEMLRSEAGDGAQGVVLLPFGLDLTAGATLSLGARSEVLPFPTCLPAGCLLQLGFSAEELAAGGAVSLATRTYDSGEALTFAVPLDGLDAALSRMGQVLNP